MDEQGSDFENDMVSLGQADLLDAGTDTFRSPLWMITNEPKLHEFISYLDTQRKKINESPQARHELVFSRKWLLEVKQAFADSIRRGEERLHRLCELLCESLLNSYQIQSVVIGEVESSHERFTLAQSISKDLLHNTTDIDLGNQQLQKLRIHDGAQWSKALLVANVVEYQAIETNRYSVHRIISRIKAEEEIWNKVVDEIFNLDGMVRRDKKLWHLSRYIKDVFGLKVVVGAPSDVRKLHQALTELSWSSQSLARLHIPENDETRAMKFLEVKDYLGQSERKNSGWEALKSVVRWWDKTFEIQIQPLRIFFREREYLTKESHAGFKSRREGVRNQIATEIPLFSFYRDLLHWLFSEGLDELSSVAPPHFEGVVLEMRE